MAIGLDQQPERILYPLRGIDVLSAIKILQGFLIFADAAINFPTRPECDRPWIKLDRHGEVIKTASRLTKLQPGKMAIEVRMRVGRIVCNPFIDNLKIVLRIGSQKIVQHLSPLPASSVLSFAEIFQFQNSIFTRLDFRRNPPRLGPSRIDRSLQIRGSKDSPPGNIQALT